MWINKSQNIRVSGIKPLSNALFVFVLRRQPETFKRSRYGTFIVNKIKGLERLQGSCSEAFSNPDTFQHFLIDRLRKALGTIAGYDL